MNRRKFVNSTAKTGLALTFLGAYACKENKKEEKIDATEEVVEKSMAEPFFKLSLAQWSINKMIRNDGVDPYTFAEKAAGWGFTGLEYVSQLYNAELEAANFSEEAMQNFVDKCNTEAKKHGLENVLIMIDRQGDLAASDEKERKEAVENHHKWVDAAAAMGCHSIRVNLNGVQEPENWVAASVDGLSQLATYAKDKNINIIVENHGGLSSNAAMLASVMTKVNMDNCGTLPDFGNFCIKRESGDYYESKCIEEYDKYKGVEELMPHAKAVSAKAYDFDENGDETKIDFARILKLVKDAGYSGYVGVEYEGENLSEEDGILATKNLLIKEGTALA
ncbi:sugar phosphate isomerase/epimerase family protein [Croceitalea vernalis]|uniref:Sugar phosphate isomerase/epimerase family protein n=1 Tax=Croceitalea vernalis TaxID=3075599 RepID=A0ABU3BEU3_9FLAO|nr:sugar phosphate isomerase/epimerase family protein [Croceitalea sp. P007]MDT0620687.1 sugar phosphate isomerase/epimerase family protein [Croceitalea sp. P007]